VIEGSSDEESKSGFSQKRTTKNSLSENDRRGKMEENGDIPNQEEPPNSKGPHRKIQQMKSNKNRREFCNKLAILVSLSVVLGAYFIVSFVLHENEVGEIHMIYKYLPLFFRRYSSLLLAYAYLRERVVNENRYATEDLGYSLPYDETLSTNIDEYYHA
jgi:hypothetical protein